MIRTIYIYALVLPLVMGCATTIRSRPDNRPGRPTNYEDPGSPGSVGGTGIESQDIVSATDRMMREILANPIIAGRTEAPRVIVDAQYFHNESSQTINKNLLTDRLRNELVRAASGRIIFLARHAADMTENERILEQNGVVTGGSTGQTQAALGYDYRLGGRIASLDAVDSRSGERSRYFQVSFEMVERGTGTIVWSGAYEFKKTAQDDIIYR